MNGLGSVVELRLRAAWKHTFFKKEKGARLVWLSG